MAVLLPINISIIADYYVCYYAIIMYYYNAINTYYYRNNGPLLPIITMSIIGNNGSIITQYWVILTGVTWGWRASRAALFESFSLHRPQTLSSDNKPVLSLTLVTFSNRVGDGPLHGGSWSEWGLESRGPWCCVSTQALSAGSLHILKIYLNIIAY